MRERQVKEEVLGLADVIEFLVRWRRTIGGTVLVFLGFVAAWTLWQPQTYQAKCTLMLRDGQNSAAALGGLAMLDSTPPAAREIAARAERDRSTPALAADLTSIALVAATQCIGTVLIHEKMFESRMYFTDKLVGLGASIILCDPHRAVVVGPSPLQGGVVESPDIRAGMALLIAALGAKGTSRIHNIRQIERGYELIDQRLGQLGARIERLED